MYTSERPRSFLPFRRLATDSSCSNNGLGHLIFSTFYAYLFTILPELELAFRIAVPVDHALRNRLLRFVRFLRLLAPDRAEKVRPRWMPSF